MLIHGRGSSRVTDLSHISVEKKLDFLAKKTSHAVGRMQFRDWVVTMARKKYVSPIRRSEKQQIYACRSHSVSSGAQRVPVRCERKESTDLEAGWFGAA